MSTTATSLSCFHCGESCGNHKLDIGDKSFCCTGCRSVFLLLNQHALGNYYCLNEQPGVKVQDIQPEKFRFLDDAAFAARLITFSNGQQEQVTLYLPQIHCSSCLWLLEHLDKVNPHIIHSRVNFATREISVSYQSQQLSLRQLAELLTTIGYEPHISLEDTRNTTKEADYSSRNAAFKLGITGFCFANIMLISFPEYLGMTATTNPELISFFRFANLLLAMPVVLYGAREFFRNAWYSFRQKYINIDAPIALAISVTFIRSVYEIATGTGAGYLDSMSGIVFFMLLGRTLQNRSYSTLRFNRDYKSYFPIAVSVMKEGKEHITPVQEIHQQDILRLHHQEVVPTDCILSKGKPGIDYSFITGESIPEQVPVGGLIYAGGKITGSAIEAIAVKDFEQNSFTRLWNNKVFHQQSSDREAMITVISRYFSAIVLLIAAGAWIWWQIKAPEHAWDALTAVLIVACPCSLLLNATFTNGYLMAFFAGKGFFLKNAQVIEQIAAIDHIAFDKTGTITEAAASSVSVRQMSLNKTELSLLLSIVSQSVHPLSRAITAHYRHIPHQPAGTLKEIPGKGIEAWIEDRHFKIGSRAFVTGFAENEADTTEVYVTIDDHIKARYQFANRLKQGIPELMLKLKPFGLSLLSGDNNNSEAQMKRLFPPQTTLHYRQSPEQKLEYIKSLQEQGKKVMMTGDGLNDAGALQQSDVGVAVVQHSFSFSPACSAILEAGRICYLPEFIRMAKTSQRIILAGFGYSILFNIVGISFAVSAHMSPMIAAILMPSSSLGIILIASLGIRLSTRNKIP